VPTTLIAKNLMQAHKWGIKTFYYSLINKQGARMDKQTNGHQVEPKLELTEIEFEESCEACIL
jgi:hypothetical protein